MNIFINPTETSFVDVDLSLDQCGLGFHFNLKSDILPFYSFTIFFLFMVIYFEWSIEKGADEDEFKEI